MKSRDPLLVELSADQLLAWRSRIEERLIADPDSAADLAILHTLVDAYLYLVMVLSTARVSIRRLKRWLFGSRSEKSKDILPADSKGCDSGDGGSSHGKGADEKSRSKRKGHGRLGVAAYPGAQIIPVPHPTLVPGACCPDANCRGKVYRLRNPRVVLRVFGQPMFTAKVWDREALRCNLCEEVFVAPVPTEAEGPKYDVTAAVMIAILRFGNGFASNRLVIPPNNRMQRTALRAAADAERSAYEV